jgi:putative transcriptional regulator
MPKAAASHLESRRSWAEALRTVRAVPPGAPPAKPPPIDVIQVRRKTGLSQTRFAARFGFSVATLRHWERRDRFPRGPALVLLNVIARNPRAVLRALNRQTW